MAQDFRFAQAAHDFAQGGRPGSDEGGGQENPIAQGARGMFEDIDDFDFVGRIEMLGCEGTEVEQRLDGIGRITGHIEPEFEVGDHELGPARPDRSPLRERVGKGARGAPDAGEIWLWEVRVFMAGSLTSKMSKITIERWLIIKNQNFNLIVEFFSPRLV
jgi:hypothetical protein